MSYIKKLVRSEYPKTISTYLTEDEYDFVKNNVNKESIAFWFREAVKTKMKKQGWKQKIKN